MKYSFILLFLVLIMATSCETKMESVFTDRSENHFTLICLSVSSNSKVSKDSMMICTLSSYLYRDLNMEILAYDDFLKQLYNHVESKKALLVDSVLYEKLLVNRVREDKDIKALYDKTGIEGVLDKYMNKEDHALLHYFPEGDESEAFNSNVNVDYIVYLCFLHDIFFEMTLLEPYGWFLREDL